MTYVPETANRQASPQAARERAPLLARLILTLALVAWVGSTGSASLESGVGNAESHSAVLAVDGQRPERRPEPIEGPVDGRLSELPIGMMVHPPALDYFNAIARADDIGAVLVVSTGLLPRITGGQRLVMSPSVELAEQRAHEFGDDTEYFGYNIEHWPDTPASEQSSPGAASAAAAEFARRHGLRYVIGPDLRFTEDFGAELAAPAEIYVIQGQRIQEDIPLFTTTVTDFAENVRRSNPSLRVWVQVSASFGTPEQSFEALQAVAGHVDGIWIHYNQNAQSFAALQQLVTLLRGPAPVAGPNPADVVLATATPTAALRHSAAPSRTVAQPTDPPTAVRSPELVEGSDTSRSTPTASQVLPAPTALPIPDASTQSPAAPWLPIAGVAIVVLAAGLIAIGFIAGSMWQHR